LFKRLCLRPAVVRKSNADAKAGPRGRVLAE
jgi:hypothetical protein